MTAQTEVTRTAGGNAVQPAQPVPETLLRPPVDIYETAEGITLHVDMPGVSKDRLNLRVEGNNLHIEGRVGLDLDENMSPLCADVRSTLYRRTFTLSSELETDKIDATLKDGLLTIRLPKRAELRPRRIEVAS